MKKRIGIFIITLILSIQVLMPPKKAQAIALLPLFYTLAPEVIPTIVQLLIAGGLTYTSIDGMMKSVNEYGGSLPGQQFITDLDNQIKASTFNDIIMIPNEKWIEFRTWIQSKFKVGTNKYFSVSAQSWTGYPNSPVGSELFPYQVIFKDTSYNFRLICSTTPFAYNNSTLYTTGDSSLQLYTLSGTTWTSLTTRSITSASNIIGGTLFYCNSDVYANTLKSSLYLNGTNTSAFFDYVGQDVLNNNTWDWTNITSNTRSLPVTMFPEGTTLDSEAVNSSLNQLINVTYNDVIAQPIPTDGTDATDDTVDTDVDNELDFWKSALDGLNKILGKLKTAPADTAKQVAEEINSIDESIADPADAVNQMEDSLPDNFRIPKLENSLKKLEEMNTGQAPPPVIKINLGAIYNAGTDRFGNPSNPFGDGERVFFDFGALNTYTWGGLPLIEYFRFIIGIGFVWTTVIYVWRKITPSESIGG